MAGEGMQSLSGRRVLVSGGTTGIGRATVEHLVAAGARVVTFSHDSETIEAARRELPGVVVEQADVANPDDVRRVVARCREELGGLDALVNNAGTSGQSVTDMAPEEWERVLRTNLLGAMHLAQEAVPLLREAEGGHIVNVGSMSAKTREEGSDVYVATKSGMRGWSDSFGRGLAKDRIAVTLVEPGLVMTELTRSEGNKDEEMMEQDRKITPDDIARVIVFILTQPLSVCIPEVQVRPRMQLI